MFDDDLYDDEQHSDVDDLYDGDDDDDEGGVY